MGFGQANYEKREFKKKNHFDTSDGDVVARILPPSGKLAAKGAWHVFHAVHWGYKNTEGKLRSFESPLVDKYDKTTNSRVVVTPDPALDRLNDLKNKLQKASDENNQPLVARLKGLVGLGGVYNIDKNQHMNVMLLDGTAGELKMRHKMFLTLKAEIDKLRADGVDPLSLDNGRFFVFHKEGKGRDTTFKVSVYKEKLDVQGVGKVERDVVSTLTAADQTRLEKEIFELDELFYKPTVEEVEQIVKESDLLTGKSAAINRIFDDRWKAKKTASDAQNNGGSSEETVSVAANSASANSTQTAQVAATAVNTTTAASTTAVSTPTVAKTAPVKTQAEAIAEMSEAEFMAMLNTA